MLALIWPRAAGLCESDPDGSVHQQRTGEVRADVVVEDSQTAAVRVPPTAVTRRVPVHRVSMDRVARRVVYHAALAARSSSI